MSKQNDLPYYVRENKSLAPIGPQDDFLHPERNGQCADATLTETQYFSFGVPEAGIHAFGYLWHHPNLKAVSGGLLAWKGFKLHMQEAEICDYPLFMSDEVLKNDLHDFRFINGYGVKVIEPLKRHRMTYHDDKRNNHVDVEFEAVSPAVMYSDSNHFEQVMRARGELVLRGRRYEVNSVDCMTLRDRSWGKPRPEDNYAFPAMDWMGGGFQNGMCFNVNMFDDARRNTELRGTQFDLPPDKVVSGGWLWRDGQMGRIVSGSKFVERDPRTSVPLLIEVEATDELGRHFEARARTTAALPYQYWHNSLFVAAQLRWKCEGQVAYGDTQEAMWSDYIRAIRR